MINYKVRLFAQLRDRTGKQYWLHETQKAVQAKQLLKIFFELYPELESLSPVTRIAVNEEFSEDQSLLSDSDEIAFIPPVSGG